MRCAVKHGRVNPANYTPRAYGHFAYVNMMDKTISPGQFKERYIRDNDLSRVQVYGMDAAHRIEGFVAATRDSILGVFARLSETSGREALNLAAPADPAPP
jgi:hypothetical protein